MSKPPIWARDEPRGRGHRSALSRAEIVRVAIEIADAEGLEAVSMRRVARELRAGAMSLYHYFDSRDELLELMADTVAAEMLVPDISPEWRPALEAIALHTRDMFRRHPWLLATMHEQSLVTPNLLRHIEQTAQAVAGVDADQELLTAIVTAVDDYTIGFTIRELGGGGRGSSERFDAPEVRYLLESGEFELIAQFLLSGARPPQPRFETGLAWLLDGFAAQLSS
ncbi:MAG TPA: TetR/AcrR family transcriptional regulator [Solirubrobacter sp.]|nr:TetR/AcrR family transcriptional regulator [Solirubrobacter sp.]